MLKDLLFPAFLCIMAFLPACRPADSGKKFRSWETYGGGKLGSSSGDAYVAFALSW